MSSFNESVSLLDTSQIETIISKLKMLNTTQMFSAKSLEEITDSIGINYDSRNMNELRQLSDELSEKIKVLQKNIDNNIFVLDSLINSYKETASEVKKQFEDINVG